MTKERNGIILNWVKWIVGLGLIALGWAYTLGVQGEKLKANYTEDTTVHQQLQSETRENREGLLKLKAQYELDVEYIKGGIKEIKEQLKK